MAGRTKVRHDSKHRFLRKDESIRADGKYQFKYHINGKPDFVYSWRLEPTDTLQVGKKPCLSLRELEERYLATKTAVKPNTLMNYKFLQNVLKGEIFNDIKISQVKTSDAKLFLIKLP